MTCPLPISFTVYTGKDNTVSLPVEGVDGAIVADLSVVTRVTFTVGSTTVDSDTAPGSIWWTGSVAFRGSTVDAIALKLGGAGLAAGRYTDCALVIYTAAAPNGLRIETPITVTVQA